MKIKQFLTILVMISLLIGIIIPVKAISRGFAPNLYPDNKNYGIGIYYAPQNITIYSEADKNSPILETIQWARARFELNTTNNTAKFPEDSFIAFYPYREIALMTVTDDQEGWVKVIYNHKENLSGWICTSDPVTKTEYNNFTGNFYTWFEFMKKIAPFKGLYFIPGVPKKQKKLRASPNDEAQAIRYDIDVIKSLQVKHIRGNWMLVKITDYMGANSPIGWIRWRDDNGNLMVFCNLD
jgi:hypothetical protein